ncbi:MAG: alpha-1,4-glucan--maltose-1-phosphate maltosyltransferase, partial [Verrucomicrobiales bacterium]|nr:alpha-1,4-glucan--maltose-1-phosphate maltosyltransferase [Verrucomicrobiales bacterium]
MGQSEEEKFQHGQQRVVIEHVAPEIDRGRFPIKRAVGEEVTVEAEIFADGHDLLSAVLQWRHSSDTDWREAPMDPLVNDRWRASFEVGQLGLYRYTVTAWIDHFLSWRRDVEKKFKAGLNVSIELRAGGQLIESVLDRAAASERDELITAARSLSAETNISTPEKMTAALSPRLRELMARCTPREHATTYSPELRVIVDPVLARFGAWYEVFPRSFSREPGRHGTFTDAAAMLPQVAEMGFDILYLPPIHPIGRSFRKGRNNTPAAAPGEPGSPWAIGAAEGGHKSVHPELGTLEDFRQLVQAANQLNLQIALDIAFQCSPDHPYVQEHPEWFRQRPDGSIQYAENPPKKYQDIYPLNFETHNWHALWHELKSVFEFWIEQGVRIFRVDNPHTKSLRFWEWCLTGLKRVHPEVIFLSEAFTRPKVMYYLAKLGFTQSYNYFPWRNTKAEIIAYLTELTQTEVHQFFRPNLWPNTPDILTQYLQYGGRPAFMTRLILAATLGASYGLYGPAFEFCENRPREAGSEEYLNSEKYEIRHWDADPPGHLRGLVAKVNQIRRANPALHRNESLRFHQIENEQIVAYSKNTPDLANIIITVVNLDPHHVQSGWLQLSLEPLGLKPGETYQVHDL